MSPPRFASPAIGCMPRFKVDDPNLLNNSGELLHNLFKTGGALDLMIGADPAADPHREPRGSGRRAVAGDARQGKDGRHALSARASAGAQTANPSPSVRRCARSASIASRMSAIRFNSLRRSKKTKRLAPNGASSNSRSRWPRSASNRGPAKRSAATSAFSAGPTFKRLQRVYWRNKATGITADIPSEAELTPQLWGLFEFGG